MTRPNLNPPRLRPRTRFGARRRAAARREPLPPAWRPAAARPRWRSSPPESGPLGFPAWFLGSLLAHLLLALALYFWPDPRKPQDQLPAPTFDIVFEGGQPEQSEAEPTEGMPTEPQPPEPPSTADVPPPPDAPPQPGLPPPPPPQQAVPQPPAPPPPSPVPAPPVPTPPVQQALPLPPPPLPPPTPRVPQDVPLPPAALPPMEPAPMPRMQGTVELFAPLTDMRLPDRLTESLPPPPPPPPPAPVQPPQQQRPTPPAQQAQPPRPNLPGMWAPGGVQLGRPQTPPAGRPQARGLDLSIDPRLTEGRPSRDPSVRVTGANVGADWRAAFRRWLDQNIHYPQQAIIRGEDGQVRVRITAAADGTVRNVQLVGPSTSPSLNFGTTYPFNGARLPTFPPGSDPNVTIDLTVNYVLIRGR